MSQTPTPGSPTPGSPRPNWRGGAPAGAGAAASATSSGRGAKLVGLLALFLALIGATVAMLLYWRATPPPDFVSLAIREYKSSVLPPNALAFQDGSLLAKRFAQDNVEQPYNTQDAEGIRRALRDLRQKDARPVVVYINALARYREGQVYLLGGNADPDRLNDAWVPLAELLQKVRDCPAPGRLLILDVMRAGPDERFGFFTAGVAEKAGEALAREKDLPFSVLLACAPGQSTQVCEELGQSLLAYYLDMGLRGYADGWGPRGKVDGRVTVTELAEYVKQHVDRMAMELYGARQTPVLLGHGADFQLAQFEEPEPPSEAAAAAYPAWLREGWLLRDKWRRDIAPLGPGVVRDLEATLLRAEQGWRGGVEEPRLKSALQAKRQLVDTQIQRIVDSRLPPLPHALPAALADGKKPAFVDALRGLLSRALDPSVKIDDKDKAKVEELDKEVKALQAQMTKQPLDAAKALFEATATAPKLLPAQVALAQALARSLALDNRFAQTVYLDRVRDFESSVRNNDWDWPMPAVQQALRAARASEAAIAEIAQDPAVLPWVVDPCKEADALRRGGEKDLFAGLPTEWPKAGRDLKEAEAQYVKVQVRARDVRQARAACARAMALLPALEPTLASQPRDNFPEAKAWQDAVLAARKLSDALAKPSPFGALEGVTALNQHLDDLQRYYEMKVLRALAPSDDAHGEDYREIQTLLESPWLDGPRREALWSAGRKLAQKFAGKVQALDKAEMVAKATSISPPGPDRGPERAALQARLRFQHAIDMIHLAGYTKTAALEKETQSAFGKADTESWTALAEKTNDVWPRLLLGEFKASEQTLPKADRLARLLSPFDLVQVQSTEPGNWSRNPTLSLYRKELAAFWQWMAGRYQADSLALDAASPYRTTYREWAEDYERLAATMP